MSPSAERLFLWLREQAGASKRYTATLEAIAKRSAVSLSSVRRAKAAWVSKQLVAVEKSPSRDYPDTYVVTSLGESFVCSMSSREQTDEQTDEHTKKETAVTSSTSSISETNDGRTTVVDDVLRLLISLSEQTVSRRDEQTTRTLLAALDHPVVERAVAALEALCRTPIPSPSATVDTPSSGTSPTKATAPPPPSSELPRTPPQPSVVAASASGSGPEATTPVSPTTPLRERILGAAADGLATGENPPRAEWLARKHGLDVLERAVSVTGWTEARKPLDKHACATILSYLTSDKIPGVVPLTLRQLVRDLAVARLAAPPWLARHLVGLEPAPVSEAQVSRQREREKPPARRTTVTEDRVEDDEREPDEDRVARRRFAYGLRPAETPLGFRDVIPKRRTP